MLETDEFVKLVLELIDSIFRQRQTFRFSLAQIVLLLDSVKIFPQLQIVIHDCSRFCTFSPLSLILPQRDSKNNLGPI